MKTKCSRDVPLSHFPAHADIFRQIQPPSRSCRFPATRSIVTSYARTGAMVCRLREIGASTKDMWADGPRHPPANENAPAHKSCQLHVFQVFQTNLCRRPVEGRRAWRRRRTDEIGRLLSASATNLVRQVLRDWCAPTIRLTRLWISSEPSRPRHGCTLPRKWGLSRQRIASGGSESSARVTGRPGLLCEARRA